jgi:hypothetical protein
VIFDSGNEVIAKYRQAAFRFGFGRFILMRSQCSVRRPLSILTISAAIDARLHQLICESNQIFREEITQMGAFCSREESNLHGLPHTVLSRTRLPFRHVSVALSGL